MSGHSSIFSYPDLMVKLELDRMPSCFVLSPPRRDAPSRLSVTTSGALVFLVLVCKLSMSSCRFHETNLIFKYECSAVCITEYTKTKIVSIRSQLWP